MREIFDVAIVGAGVVGASVFNKLTRIGKSCALIDKASDVATGASKANSAIIHAGHDPKPGTLKAILNVKGNKMYPALCKRLGIKLKKCGAIVVGDDETQIDALVERAKQNGVYVEKWNREKLEEKIPVLNKNITIALYARDSYIVSPYLLTIALTDEAILNGGKVFLEQDILKISKEDEIFEIKTQAKTIFARQIVNSAAAGYNEISKLLKSEQYPIEFRRGEYFVFDKVNDLEVPFTVFPLPTKLGKGVLVTPTVDGNYLVGPTSEESDDKTVVTNEGLNDIKNKSKNIISTLNFKNAIREFSGVRVICGDDFIIEKSKSVKGVINLAGICSPGLTSAPAIAEMVCKLLGFKTKEKENLQKIKPYKMFKDYSKAEQKELLKTNPNHRSIVCKCEKITKGDILFALQRPLKPKSVDGIKRRTNAGMGRCQGGFCFSKVVQELAKEVGYKNVLKENRGSEVVFADIREVNHD